MKRIVVCDDEAAVQINLIEFFAVFGFQPIAYKHKFKISSVPSLSMGLIEP